MNLIEVYYCPNQNTHPKGWLDLEIHKAQIRSLLKTLKRPHDIPQEFTEYHYRDIYDCYDHQTDMHRITQNYVCREELKGLWYWVELQQEVLPPHRFPNIRSLSEKRSVSRHVIRMNGRVNLIIENAMVYLQIPYNSNMDRDILNKEIADAMKKVEEGSQGPISGISENTRIRKGS